MTPLIYDTRKLSTASPPPSPIPTHIFLSHLVFAFSPFCICSSSHLSPLFLLSFRMFLHGIQNRLYRLSRIGSGEVGVRSGWNRLCGTCDWGQGHEPNCVSVLYIVCVNYSILEVVLICYSTPHIYFIHFYVTKNVPAPSFNWSAAFYKCDISNARQTTPKVCATTYVSALLCARLVS